MFRYSTGTASSRRLARGTAACRRHGDHPAKDVSRPFSSTSTICHAANSEKVTLCWIYPLGSHIL
jgi:hypothetical protein